MIQAAVMEIWRNILERDDIRLDDNFFDVGGDSARLAAGHKQLEQLVQRKLPLVELFRHTTVRALGAWLESLAEPATGHRDTEGLARVSGPRRSRSAAASPGHSTRE
jgi:mycobactin peptide synthetase MbtE